MAIKLIKDIVGGNSVFSEIEGQVFSSALYNRLHNILQNSCTYLVYPTNRTSRFSHSLGTMSTTTKLMNYSFCNANKDTIKGYLEENSIVINDMLQEDDVLLRMYEKEKILEVIGSSKNNILNHFALNKHLSFILGSEFINHVSTYNSIFNDTKLFNCYLIIHQAIRLYALLHDVGHFPYSHITEYAINQSYGEASQIENLNKDIGLDFIELMRTLFKCGDNSEVDVKYSDLVKIFDLKNRKDIELHEIFGKMISALILTNIMNEKRKEIQLSSDSLGDKYMELLSLFLITKTLMEIFKGKTGKLYSLYQIIDNGSGIDVDKIDYIYRDCYASGIDSNFDTDRILKMYCLIKFTGNNGRDNYQYVPSIQSLNDVNELFLARFRIYKYIVGHHKVKRYDYILYTLIRLMLAQRISNEIPDKNDFDLSFILTVLTKVALNIKTAINGTAGDNISSSYDISQLTDSWLLSVLQNERKRLNQNKLKLANAPDEINAFKYSEPYIENNILRLLEEFFTASKSIKSLWKRDHEYNVFCEELGAKTKNNIIEFFESNYENYFKITPQPNALPKKFYCDYLLSNFSVDFSKDRLTYCNFIEKTSNKDIGKKIIFFLNNLNEDWTINATEKFMKDNKLIIFAGLKNTLKVPDGQQKFVDIKGCELNYKYADISVIPKFLDELRNNSAQFYIFYEASNEMILKNDVYNEIKSILFNNFNLN